MISAEEIERLKEILASERQRLEKSLNAEGKRDPKDVSNWDPTFPTMGEGHNASSSMMEENADEIEEYETRLETEDALETRLADVIRALEKIEAGTYGLCEACGKPIPIERLGANPAARFDMEHAD